MKASNYLYELPINELNWNFAILLGFQSLLCEDDNILIFMEIFLY